MGKFHSKQVRCVLFENETETSMNKDIDKYNITCHSVEELLMSCYDNNKDFALNVDIPTEKCLADNKTINLLTLDQEMTNSASTSDNNKSPSKLNLEELECGICVKCSENSKKEWMFTLYDFDGQGKVTKEDLSTLLKALYDAVGSSLKLPSNSMKSLKLRLSVGSDDNSSEYHVNPKTLTPLTQSIAKVTRHSTSALRKEQKLQKVNNNITQATKTCKSNLEKVEQETQIKPVEHYHLAELVQENMVRNRIALDRLRSKKRPVNRRRFKTGNLIGSRQLKENAGIQGTKPNDAPRSYCLDLAAIKDECLNVDKADSNTETMIDVNNSVPHNADSLATNKQPATICQCLNQNKDTVNPAHGTFQHTFIAESGTTNLCNSDNANQKNSSRHSQLLEETRNNSKSWSPLDCKVDVKNSTQISNNNAVKKIISENGKNYLNSHISIRNHKPLDNCQTACFTTSASVYPPVSNSNINHVVDVFIKDTIAECSPKRSCKVANVDMTSPKTKVRSARPMSVASNVATNGSANQHKRHKHREFENSLAMRQVAEWIEREYVRDLSQKCFRRHEHHHIHHHHHHHYHVT